MVHEALFSKSYFSSDMLPDPQRKPRGSIIAGTTSICIITQSFATCSAPYLEPLFIAEILLQNNYGNKIKEISC